MLSGNKNKIVVSHSNEDKDIASQLRDILQSISKSPLWIRDFDLSAGEMIAQSTEFAMSDAAWFILILSQNSMKSPWVEQDANVATLRSLEDRNFSIIILKVDDAEVPQHLQACMDKRLVFRVSEYGSIDDTCLEVLAHIERSEPKTQNHDIFVDRGNDIDRFSLQCRKNHIIFVLGLPGVGKTSFVRKRVKDFFGKHLLRIKLTRGHSLDLLCRELIRGLHVEQPYDDIEDKILLELTVRAIERRSDQFFILLDDTELALDIANSFLPYLEEFLTAIYDMDVKAHIVLATTRKPDYFGSLSSLIGMIKLEPMEDQFIRECLELWSSELDFEIDDLGSLDDLVALASGHPLAARFIAMNLAVMPADQLLAPSLKDMTRRRFADYMLKTVSNYDLNDLEKTILKILSLVDEPMRLRDILACKKLARVEIDKIHASWSRLNSLFILQQEGELISVAPFCSDYFRNLLSDEPELFHSIAHDVGMHAYTRALSYHSELHRKRTHSGASPEAVVELSNEVFRYAVSAHKLLGYVNQYDKLDDLPYKIKGSLREMVYYYYQKKEDYISALKFAEQWLAIAPKDGEIMLYQARAYRRLKDEASLHRAEKIVEKIEAIYPRRKQLRAKLYRERGLISQNRGDFEDARDYFRKGIDLYVPHSSPLNHLAMARLLIIETSSMPDAMFEKKEQKANEALKLLDVVRKETNVFDRYELETYIEALILAGRDEEAMPLLQDVLFSNPADPRWNYRMAEVLRKQSEYQRSIEHANAALDGGYEMARLTLANSMIGRWQELKDVEPMTADTMLDTAVNYLENMRSFGQREKSIADAIRAKAQRLKGDWVAAGVILDKYENYEDPYIIYEQTFRSIHQYKIDMEDNPLGALADLKSAKSRLVGFGAKYKLNENLTGLLGEINEILSLDENNEEWPNA